MFYSIRWRLIVSYVLLTLLIVAAVGLLALWGVRQYAIQQETSYLKANAEAIARQAAPLLWPRPNTSELNQLAEVASFFGNTRVRIISTQQQVLADSGRSEQAAHFTWLILPLEYSRDRHGGANFEGLVMGMLTYDSLSPAVEGLPFAEQLPPGSSWTIVRMDPGPWGNRFSFSEEQEQTQANIEDTSAEQRSTQMVRVPVGDARQPMGFVELSGGLGFSAETLTATRRGLLLAGAIAVLLAGLLGLLMGRRLTTPIAELTETTRRMSAGDLSVRAQVSGNDEIGELAAGFNSMAIRLQSSFDQIAAERDTLRRFIADASHELRTPITALRNFNDLLLDGADDDPEAREEFLLESQAQIERLSWITQNLLDLSRLDAGLVALETGEYALGELLESAVTLFRARATEAGVNIQIKLQESDRTAEISVDRGRLLVALSNLIDNALKFSPKGSTMQVGAERSSEQVHLWVADEGPGVHSDDLPHIFDRFYRGRHGAIAPGSGLGLSIVQSVVQAHGGRVWVEDRDGGGAIFQMELPVIPKE